MTSQSSAFRRQGLSISGTQTFATLVNGWQLVLERSRPDNQKCADFEIFIAPKWQTSPEGGCIFIGEKDFETCAIAINFEDGEHEIRNAAPHFPLRPWNNSGRPYQ